MAAASSARFALPTFISGTMVLSFRFAAAATLGRAIAFDRPGFGYSTRPLARSWTPSEQADVIAEALRRLNCGPAEIVGHSWGTLIAISYQRT